MPTMIRYFIPTRATDITGAVPLTSEYTASDGDPVFYMPMIRCRTCPSLMRWHAVGPGSSVDYFTNHYNSMIHQTCASDLSVIRRLKQGTYLCPLSGCSEDGYTLGYPSAIELISHLILKHNDSYGRQIAAASGDLPGIGTEYICTYLGCRFAGPGFGFTQLTDLFQHLESHCIAYKASRPTSPTTGTADTEPDMLAMSDRVQFRVIFGLEKWECTVRRHDSPQVCRFLTS
jgi:hypothetical protein